MTPSPAPAHTVDERPGRTAPLLDVHAPHWREYAAEAFGLGSFMVAAASAATVLQHPDSAVARWMEAREVTGALARLPMGMAMGLTAMAIIYSRPGQRSGAHLNPAVTLAFAWLGRIAARDVAGYIAAQLTGGLLGLIAAVVLLDGRPAAAQIHYVATVPGSPGAGAAFVAEAAISFLLMTTVLRLSADGARSHLTGVAAGALVAVFIIVEAPLSGMSMNPARTLASNLLAGELSSLWIYMTAPPLGMVAAAALHRRTRQSPPAGCAKLHHRTGVPCIFCQQVCHHD